MPVLEPKKELRSHKISVLVGGGIAGALTLWLAIPAPIKVTFLLAGVAVGFLVAIVRFNHWNEVMNISINCF